MKYFIVSFFVIFKCFAGFYDAKIPILGGGGKLMDLSTFKGKPVLVVNIATQCGYTPQLDGLQKLYTKFKDKGLVVLGIPSNDFGGQTPEDEKGVQKFCKLNYGVDFPLTQKMVVKGPEKNPIVKTLLEGSKDKNEIKWNFEKFLLGKQGQVLKRFGSAVSPDDQELIKAIEETL